jgi:uracil phosphoribosyltransferase
VKKINPEIRILGNDQSLFNQYLSEIRDENIQQDRMRFRRNIERMGEIFAYEISKHLPHVEKRVQTPLGISPCRVIAEQPVLATILRAGLPLHQGLLNYFDQAENTFISAYRKHEGDEESFEVQIEYLSSPPLDGKTVILCDPMLASGSSMVLAYKALLEKGIPAQLHVAVVIASEEGLEFAARNLPENTHFWVGDVDTEMTSRKYIVPGLGDAGDLSYGAKD